MILRCELEREAIRVNEGKSFVTNILKVCLIEEF